MMPVAGSKPRKPSKTAAELEAAIKLELKEVNRCPPNIAVTVFPDGRVGELFSHRISRSKVIVSRPFF